MPWWLLGSGAVVAMLIGASWAFLSNRPAHDAVGGMPLATQAQVTGSMDECRRVVENMPALLRHNRAESFSPDQVLQNADLLRDYDRACFRPYAELSPVGQTVIGAMAGALFVKSPADGSELFRCSAFRLSPSVVATARHCLLFGGDAGVFEPAAFTFRLFGAPDMAFPVQGHVPAQHLLPADTSAPAAPGDHWMLRVDTRAVAMPDAAALVVQAPDPGERLSIVVIGPNLFLPLLPGGEGTTWTEWIRYDDRPDCNTVVEGPGCLPHRCNTLQGMSGAPIIGKRGDRPNSPYLIVGLHLRSAEASDPACGRDPEGNLGVVLPPALRAQFQPTGHPDRPGNSTQEGEKP